MPLLSSQLFLNLIGGQGWVLNSKFSCPAHERLVYTVFKAPIWNPEKGFLQQMVSAYSATSHLELTQLLQMKFPKASDTDTHTHRQSSSHSQNRLELPPSTALERTSARQRRNNSRRARTNRALRFRFSCIETTITYPSGPGKQACMKLA